MSRVTYVVATLHPWNIEVFGQYSRTLPGEWRLVSSAEGLQTEKILKLNPRYIFFPHWSWKIPDALHSNIECIGFHATDLPYGRGGSPVQNLIAAGHQETKLSAFRITGGMDEGGIYLKKPLSLDGAAKDIYRRASILIGEMIAEIVRTEISPTPQTGPVTIFKRRTPAQSELPAEPASLREVYDHIRMLDAPDYPHAFARVGRNLLQFTDAKMTENAVYATVKITRGE